MPQGTFVDADFPNIPEIMEVLPNVSNCSGVPKTTPILEERCPPEQVRWTIARGMPGIANAAAQFPGSLAELEE